MPRYVGEIIRLDYGHILGECRLYPFGERKNWPVRWRLPLTWKIGACQLKSSLRTSHGNTASG
jgi:hypothetical protein